MSTEITPGQTSDCPWGNPVSVDTLLWPSVPPAGRGHDGEGMRKTMEACDVLTRIPMRRSSKTLMGLVHPRCSLRKLVKRCLNKLKDARPIATREEKTAQRVRRFIEIVAIRLWLRLLSRWPKTGIPRAADARSSPLAVR